MKIILILFFTALATQIKSQSLPPKIDLGSGFNSIEKYNMHINEANKYHYRSAKTKGKAAAKIIITIALVSGFVYASTSGIIGKDTAIGIGAGLAPLSILSIINASQDLGSTYNSRQENEHIKSAREVLQKE